MPWAASSARRGRSKSRGVSAARRERLAWGSSGWAMRYFLAARSSCLARIFSSMFCPAKDKTLSTTWRARPSRALKSGEAAGWSKEVFLVLSATLGGRIREDSPARQAAKIHAAAVTNR